MFSPRYSIRSLMAITMIVAVALTFAAKVGPGLAANSLSWATFWTVVLWLIGFANPEIRGRIQFIWLWLVVVAVVSMSGLLAIVTESLDVARLRLPPLNTETEIFQAFVFVGTVCGLLFGTLAGLCCIQPIGIASNHGEFTRVFPQTSQFSKRLTLARSCILIALMTFVGIAMGEAVTLLIWVIEDVHPDDKWVLLEVYGKVGAMGGFIGGCVWCGTLAIRQIWHCSHRAGKTSPTAGEQAD